MKNSVTKRRRSLSKETTLATSNSVTKSKSDQNIRKLDSSSNSKSPIIDPNSLFFDVLKFHAKTKEESLLSLISKTRARITEKEILIRKLRGEVTKMERVFDKIAKLQDMKGVEGIQEQDDFQTNVSHKDRLEQLEHGPFNLVFHGLKPDWIEQEMADDPDFKRDVLEQRVKKLIKEEAGMVRDIPLVDVYRYYEGPKIREAPPVVVSFKNRKDKENVLWRSKDKLRRIGIMITEDSTARLAKMSSELSKDQRNVDKSSMKSPKKKKK